MRLLSRGDVIAPCKSSDDEDSSAPSPAPDTTKLRAIRLKEEDASSKQPQQQEEAKRKASGGLAGSVRAKYRFMKTKAEEGQAGLPSSRDKPKSSRLGEQEQQQQLRDSSAKPAATAHRKLGAAPASASPAPSPRALPRKRAVSVATSPTHALAAAPSTSATAKLGLTSPRSSPGSAAARLGLLQSPENDSRGRSVALDSARNAAFVECASPRPVRSRGNLGSARSKSGELGLAKSKSGELGMYKGIRSGELGLTRPHEGRNKSGEITLFADPVTRSSARNNVGAAQQSTLSSTCATSPHRLERSRDQTKSGLSKLECLQPPTQLPPPPAAAAAAAAAAPATAAAPAAPMLEAINLQDLEAGRVTDFNAASYDFAPGQAVQPDGKQHQFWLAATSDTDDESEAFDPFCIPTICAAGGVPATPTKPHKANDPYWEAVRTTRSRDGVVGLSHFRLLKRLGCGDIGSVYLAELRGTSCYFAMKVMDKGTLDNGKKQERAQTEREILELLDHPFLPTLYAHFDTPQFTCLVMEFCPGGDLHSLRQSQPAKCFGNSAARFYAAEVLLALEYLHMMGVVYRDLKPENVLVRKDGHIMLSDFDLSLKCDVSPTLLQTTTSSASLATSCLSPVKRHSFSSYNQHVRNLTSCIMPACRVPSCSLVNPPCMSGLPATSSRANLARRNSLSSNSSTSSSLQASLHSLSGSFRRKHLRRESFSSQVVPLPELVAEPTEARSMSFVGTHEYLAPEIISGDGHGSAVDWWTFGIFLYELLYGKTPFRGADNQSTLRNVLTQGLRFPEEAPGFDEEEEGVSEDALSLIRGLLIKDPKRRLGSARGAGEIKAHPFFECVNWALIRCARPPEVPKAFRPPDSVATVGGRTPPPSPVTDRDPAQGQGGPDSDVDFGDFF